VFLLLKVSILPHATIFLLDFGNCSYSEGFLFFILSLLSLNEIDSNRGNENM